MTITKPAGLLCLDCDGTLFNSQHRVSETNAAALSEASSAGYAIALCTGRSLNCWLPTASQLGLTSDRPLYFVGCNGAVVASLSENSKSAAEVIFETKLSSAQIERLALGLGRGRALKADVGNRQLTQWSGDAQQNLVAEHNHIEETTPEIVDDLCATLKQLAAAGHAPNKFTVFDHDKAALGADAAKLEVFEGIRVVSGGPFWVDTVDVEHDKAGGISMLCERLGLELADCIGFGDGANDSSMLQACGLGIAMAQGREEAKSAANRVSQWTNDEDAVGREIRAILSLQK